MNKNQDLSNVDVQFINFNGEPTSFAAKTTGKIYSKLSFVARVNFVTNNNKRKHFKGENKYFLVEYFQSGKFNKPVQEIVDNVKKGDIVSIEGTFMPKDNFHDRKYFSANKMILKSKFNVTDNSSKDGRYELSVHTKMSQLNSIIDSQQAINWAVEHGLAGMAFTDDNSVQSYPTLINNENKFNAFQPIFGVKLSAITNEPTFVYHPTDKNLLDDNNVFVAFDIETTGLNARINEIIQISAVKYRTSVLKDEETGEQQIKLEKIDLFNRFVKIKGSISEKINKITHISDIDLKDDLDESLTSFMNFIKGTILIGQNVKFDLDFINEKLKQQKLSDRIAQELFDTLTIARRLLPRSRSYNLSTLASKLGVKLTQAHRSDNDAEATGYVFEKLLNLMIQEKFSGETEINGQQIQSVAKSDENAFYEGIPFSVHCLAKNQVGIKNIYRLISIASTEHIYYEPRSYYEDIFANHEGILIGTGGVDSKFWEDVRHKPLNVIKDDLTKYDYDYIEIMPFEQSGFDDIDDYKNIIKELIKLSYELKIPAIVVSDARVVNDSEMERIAYVAVTKDYNEKTGEETHRRVVSKLFPTDELFKSFSFLDEKVANEIIVENTQKIAQQIDSDSIKPIVTDVNPPIIKNADKELTEMTMKRAHELYGEKLDPLIEERIKTELDFIIKGGYAVHYLTAQKIVKKSNEMGYIVGSRGSVGSSFVAFLAKITEVNALPPHYRSEDGRYFEWCNDVYDGFDLPKKRDPLNPDKWLIRDGHNIPFATFLGIKGNKIPDIDLNAASDIQGKLQKYLGVIFGQDHIIRVGTISTLAEMTARMLVHKYQDAVANDIQPTEFDVLAQKLVGIKRTSGQHPAGIMIVPKNKEIIDYTPINYPSNKVGEWKTTHYGASDMHDALLKMDVLGHDDPSMLHKLQKLTGVDPRTIDVSDEKIFELFKTDNVSGIPEFNTNFARGILSVTKPKTFYELVQISGLSHGTNVWEGNAYDLITKDNKTLSEVIGSRDKIMTDLMKHNLEPVFADKIATLVKKNKPIPDEDVQKMLDAGIEPWYIESAKKIEYLYPAAHAVAYVMSALRIAYFKVYYPTEFAAAVLSYRYDQFDVEEIASNDLNVVSRKMIKYTKMKERAPLSTKDDEKLKSLKFIFEMMNLGVKFEKPSLLKSMPVEWTIDKDTHKLIAPLSAIDGLGTKAAENIVEYRQTHNNSLPTDYDRFRSKKDGVGVNKTVVKRLEEAGVLTLTIEQKTETKKYKNGKVKEKIVEVGKLSFN